MYTFLCLTCASETFYSSEMGSVDTVTQKLAAMKLAHKGSTPTLASSSSHPTIRQVKQVQPGVAKLLTKFAAPNPFQDASNKPLHKAASSVDLTANPKAAVKSPLGAQPSFDIGAYDGGLEQDERGSQVFGAAAEELALDSSTAQYVSLT